MLARRDATCRGSTTRSSGCARGMLMLMPDCVSKTVNSAAQAQAAALGREQHHEPRVARAQHDDRGPRRLPRVQRGPEGPTARWTSSSCASCSAQGHPWDDELLRAISPQFQPEGAGALTRLPMDLGLAGRAALVTGGASRHRRGDRARAGRRGLRRRDRRPRRGRRRGGRRQVAAPRRCAGSRAGRDVRDFAPARRRGRSEVAQAFGRLDILVCNAGITCDGVVEDDRGAVGRRDRGQPEGLLQLHARRRWRLRRTRRAAGS